MSLINTLQYSCRVWQGVFTILQNHRGLTYGGDSSDNLSKLELVENGGLPRSIEPDHQDPHLLFPEEALQENTG